MRDGIQSPLNKGGLMKKAIGFAVILSLSLVRFLSAQTKVRVGWKAGYSLATQYGSLSGR